MDIPTVAPIKPTPKAGDAPVISNTPSKRPRHRAAVRMLGFFAGMVMAIPVIAFFAIGHVPFDELKSALTMPGEIRGAVLHTIGENNRDVLTKAGWWWYRDVAGTSRAIDSVLRLEDGRAAYITRDSGMAPWLEIDGAPVTELPPSAIGLAVSPSGTKFAYTYALQPVTTTNEVDATLPTVWGIGVYDSVSRTTFDAARGFGPFFVDEGRLARITPAGVQSLSFADSSYATLLEERFTRTIVRTAMSPDRTLIAIVNPGMNRTVVYRLTDTGLTEVATYMEVLQNIALGDAALYELRSSPEGTSVWRRAFDDTAPRKIHQFPSNLEVVSMSL